MKTSHILTTLAVVATLAVVNVAAAATTEGDDQASQRGMEEVKQAVGNGDYNAWLQLTSNHPKAAKMLENINADNFYLLGEMHQARQGGDMEKAKEIADELGFEPGQRMQKGQRGNGKTHQMREEVKTALENRDYSAWQEAMTPKICDYVNEGNFNTFADMHEAMKSGDKETAEELKNQLGLPERQAPQNGQGMKMGQK